MMRGNIQTGGHLIILTLLILAGSFLRFYHLDYNPFWFDEAFTLFAAGHTLAGIWDIVTNNSPELAGVLLTAEFNPPLFLFLEHLMLVFGRSEFILRFIPALAGVLTIPVFYLIGKDTGDETTGIIMAALVTFSPFHVFYSQDARPYPVMLLFFSLAFFFFFVSLRTRSVRFGLLFGLFAALTFWTHYSAVIPLGVLFAYLFFHGAAHGGKEREHYTVAGISLFTFLALSAPLLPLSAGLFVKRTGIPPLWGAKGWDLAGQIFYSLSGYNRSILALFLVLFILGLVFFWKKERAKTLLMAGLLVIPVIASLYLAERMPMTARYLICLLPVFFLGISLSLPPLAGLSGRKDTTILLIVLFFLVQAPFLASYYVPYYTGYSKEDWRGMAHLIEGTSANGDHIIVVPYYTRLPLDIYYNNTSDGTYETGVRNESGILTVIQRLENNQAYFVVSGHIAAADPDGSTAQWLKNNTERIGMTRNIELYRLNVAE